ncbi:MAG: type II toxin-antitoxin system RelE/ParE family toxin [Chloroflexi bacterium]|nr:type II toxin-antitoxin system RelE/ParE family toxin [Chloroflexota bacterium]
MVKTYSVEFRPEARDSLRRLSPATAQRVLDKIKWLAENFDHVPHEALTGEFKGLFKLRTGDYRVIYSIDSAGRLIIVHLIGHRRSVYEPR